MQLIFFNDVPEFMQEEEKSGLGCSNGKSNLPEISLCVSISNLIVLRFDGFDCKDGFVDRKCRCLKVVSPSTR
jgi:hypothetical protein